MKRLYLIFTLLICTVLSLQAQQKIIINFSNGDSLVRRVSEVKNIVFRYDEPIPYVVDIPVVTYKAGITATLSAKLESGDREYVTEYGMYCSSDPTNILGGKHVTTTNVSADGTFSVSFSDLLTSTKYYALAYVIADSTVYSVDTLRFVTAGEYPIAQAVDLGLSVKWASWNIGSQKSNDYGSYVGWGDPTGKVTSIYAIDYASGVTSDANISGTEYDIATDKWGKGWQTPTVAQFKELQENCTWTSTTVQGVSGYRITGKNGNSIFLPSPGFYSETDKITVGQGNNTYYWTSEHNSTTTGVQVDLRSFNVSQSDVDRAVHMAIRPVFVSGASEEGETDSQGEKVPLNKTKAGEAVDLGFNFYIADRNVGAASADDGGNFYAWGEDSTKEDYSNATYKYATDAGDGYTFKCPDNLDDISRSKYDVARMEWGGKWRMMTYSEALHLSNDCSWTWDADRRGFVVTGTNGKSIFLPAVGYYKGTSIRSEGNIACYWASANYVSDGLNGSAYCIQRSSSENGKFLPSITDKRVGYCIRPVRDK